MQGLRLFVCLRNGTREIALSTTLNNTPAIDMREASHITVPHVSTRTLVVSSAMQVEVARDVVRSLNASPHFSARWSDADSAAQAEDPPDFLVQVVDATDFSETLRLLSAYRQQHPARPLLAVTVGLTASESTRLLAAGVSDFICAPATNDELLVRSCRALGRTTSAPTARSPLPALRNLIGSSPAFMRQVARVPMLAKYDAGVLLLGETGTGKEVCAQAIHYLSPRAGKPWVAVNCGAIPIELIEAELFGHVKGAYTHAHAARPGLVREAEGGTLFLDEIDSLPYNAQAKLLRFLQDKEYRSVGSNTVMRADVRVIAASNRQLGELAASGAFRQDLFFRLNVLMLHLPALRERRDDIPQLALFFLRGAARQWQCAEPALAPSALKKLLAHDWPGNVRELKNVMERAVLMAQGGAQQTSLQADDIDLDGVPAMAEPTPACDESFRVAKARVVETFERAYIQQLLASNGGNVTHAARAAKKNRRAFFELMRKHRIEPDPYRAD